MQKWALPHLSFGAISCQGENYYWKASCGRINQVQSHSWGGRRQRQAYSQSNLPTSYWRRLRGKKSEVSAPLLRAFVGFGGKLGSSASLARSNILSGGRIMIPSRLIIICFGETFLLILSARFVIKKKNPHPMLFGSAPWLGIPRL